MNYVKFKKMATLFCACLLSLPMIARELIEDLISYVNPFIGAKEMGHVFTGACVSLGMVQLSPDTDTIPYVVKGKYTGAVYRYCAGCRITSGWARTNYIYFAMVFSKPILSYGSKNDEDPVYKGFWRRFDHEHNFKEIAEKNLKTHFDSKTTENEKIEIKFVISAVSTEGALKNLLAEVPHFDFETVRTKTKKLWQNELQKKTIDVSAEKKTSFYTLLYHSFINPIRYMDVDGKYRGLDHNIHQADSLVNYSVSSLWDTYRVLHPLFMLIQPKRTSDMINLMLAHYNQSVHHILPVWSHFCNESWCMTGYHSVPVIADVWTDGIRGFDGKRILNACVVSANNRSYANLGDYIDYEYLPYDFNNVGVSITLKYAYDDWTIAQFAHTLREPDIKIRFEQRAKNWAKLFDEKFGLVRAKDKNGNWKSPFDPLQTYNEGSIEGNAWNYSLYISQDIPGLTQKMGSSKRLSEHLCSLFTMFVSNKYFAETEDITREGLMECYIHGNEPSHHVLYVYNWAGKPWGKQERVHQIINTKYFNKPEGLCGNDDCGQMSVWYIFSSLGFCPVCLASGEYAISSPSVNHAEIQLGEGKKLRIKAANLTENNIYIQLVTSNGKPVTQSIISHQLISMAVNWFLTWVNTQIKGTSTVKLLM